MHDNQAPNELINSHSPYLLQHAYNPVQWQEWSAKVWEQAVAENKPVIVSIGYSACHWCHVMEKESFEDFETAEIMNQHFLCIKVDREERPDVDAVYMEACQHMTGKGGWPLNAICLPNQTPVYAGTYFPKKSWQSILLQLSEVFQKNPETAEEYANKLTTSIEEANKLLGNSFPDLRKKENIQEILQRCENDFDYNFGGNNRVPKFIVPVYYEMLMDIYKISTDKNIFDFITFTFIKILNGGIYDHLRGGIYRYSTDERWFAPHFEKMLYDNAQFLSLLSKINEQVQLEVFKEAIINTINFCEGELLQENGAYAAALDADSEGIEGRFYCFTYTELAEALTPEELSFTIDYYGITKNGNWEHELNILHKPYAPAELLNIQKISASEFVQISNSVNTKLLALQNTRIRPGLDNKVLSGWNGLMLKGLCNSYVHLGDKNILNKAKRLADLLINDFILEEGTLLRTNTNKIKGFAEDYAAVILGFYELYSVCGEMKYFEKAVDLLQKSIDLFFDEKLQLFAFNNEKEEQLFVKNFDTTDDVIPSANAMFCEALLKFGILEYRTNFIDMATKMVDKMQDRIIKLSPWYSLWATQSFALILDQIHIKISGDKKVEIAIELKKQMPSFIPIIFITSDEINKNTIQICNSHQCFEPVNTVENALEILEELYGV